MESSKSSAFKLRDEITRPVAEPDDPTRTDQGDLANTEGSVSLENGPEGHVEHGSSPRRRGEEIRALRSMRKTTTSTLFNVSLDEPLKNRLELASFDNKVKQTVIVLAAISDYLKKNGY